MSTRRPYERSDRSRRPNGLVVVGAVFALAVVVTAVALVAVAEGDGEQSSTATFSACPTRQFPEQQPNHIEALPAGYEYNSFPPTSGAHHPVPAIWGSYTEQVPSLNLVHNLEHGGVVVQYGSAISAEARAELEEWYRDDPNGIVVAPLPELEDEVTATAWRWRMTCTGFDERALTQFREEFRAQGPERFPLDALTPGS